jgi:hypothetical protein
VRHPGQHPAIVERELWDKVQLQLLAHATWRNLRAVKVEASPLAGKLFDSAGASLTPSHACKGARRYRYYITRGLNIGPAHGARDSWRLPAPEIERTVAAAAGQLLGDEPAIATAVEEAGVAPSRIPSVLETARAWSRKLQSESEATEALAGLVHRVELSRDGLRLSLNVPMPPDQNGEARAASDAIIIRFIPMRLQRRGAELRLVIQNAHSVKVDLALLKALGRAGRWFDQLALGQVASLSAIAQREGIGVRYVARLIPLAFLAPRLVEIIAEGRQPAELTTEMLTRRTVLPLEWEAQQRTVGVATAGSSNAERAIDR